MVSGKVSRLMSGNGYGSWSGENVRLRMERELLKRAVAFWVRESNE